MIFLSKMSEYLTTLQKTWLLTVAHVKMTYDELARIRVEAVLASCHDTSQWHALYGHTDLNRP